MIMLLRLQRKNQYQMIPQDRNTDFGTFNEALRLTVFFEGQELDAKVTTTFLRGHCIYDNNQVIGDPKGIYLKRPY